jgi:DNA repair ATPase RecN
MIILQVVTLIVVSWVAIKQYLLQLEAEDRFMGFEQRLQNIITKVEEGNAKADEALATIEQLKSQISDMEASEDEVKRLEELLGLAAQQVEETKVEVPETPAEETASTETEATETEEDEMPDDGFGGGR